MIWMFALLAVAALAASIDLLYRRYLDVLSGPWIARDEDDRRR
jgi:hypothetical protein